MKLVPVTFAKHAIENDLDLQKEVENGTTHLVLHVEKYYQKNAIGLVALNKLYHYSHDAEMIFDLAIALINGATQEDVRQMKEAEYIEYTMELAGFDYEDEVKTYHQIASHTYPTKEAQIQQLEQMNIQLCEKCVMPCDDQWCLECYAFSIPLPDENNENEIEFGVSEQVEELPTTPIYLFEKQPPLQLKYFDNHGQGIKPEKAHEIDTGYDLRYPEKDTLILQPKSLTKINLKIALEIPPGAIVQIASRSSLASKKINIRGRVIDAEYTEDITIILQNETDKPFKIEHAEKIAQAIYLPLINISGLQSVNNREQLGKSERGTQSFDSTGQFTVPVNIVLNTQNESHQILQLPQPITISSFGEHHEIYTCSKPTTTQQIFESNEQIYKNPQIVSNFIEIIKHTLLPNPNIIPITENYHLLEEKLSQINMTEFADIFAKDNNDLGKTDIVQHQIHTGDALPKRQQAYRVPSASHQLIREEIQ
ncbi:hypothetical protein G9A89_014480 [Geosiphon pyriformis]|nr:hypothetical protein G9A89_014480 [Geosiphon pyriformis]